MDEVNKMLARLTEHWRSNALVNKGGDPAFNTLFMKEKGDFSEHLLPFSTHPLWHIAPEAIRNICLSYGWILYNRKTIFIECDVVTPCCEEILKYGVDGIDRQILHKIIGSTLLDEALHTQMSSNACNIIFSERKLEPICHRDFFLISELDGLLSSVESKWEKRLIRIGVAAASETLITDYLKTLSVDENIQPLCRDVTAAHLKDEFLHSGIFTSLMDGIVEPLQPVDKEILAMTISKATKMFGNKELGVWEDVLQAINFPQYREMLRDCAHVRDIGMCVDSVSNLLERSGLINYVRDDEVLWK